MRGLRGAQRSRPRGRRCASYATPAVLEPEPLDVRRAAHADQDLVDRELLLGAARAREVQRASRRRALDTRRTLAPWTTRMPSSAKRRSRIARGVGVLARQQVRVGVQHHHLAAEPAEGLRQLAADRARADHAEARAAARSG